MNLDARTLAAALLAAQDDALRDLLATRAVAPSVAWRDFFDAAAALLEPSSVRRGLAALPRAAAVALHAGQPHPALVAGAMSTPDGTPYAAVAAVVATLPVPDEETPQASPEANAGRAAERAFVTVGVTADLLVSVLRTPLQRIGTGAVGAADRRRLVDDGVLRAPDDADLVITLAANAGLVRATPRQWRAEAAAVSWLQSTTQIRWATLATAFRAALPQRLRTTAGGWLPFDSWRGAHPWDDEWPQRADGLLMQADALGLRDGGAGTAWADALAAGDAADPATLLTLLPHEVDRVFLQNDLTAIAPGPLAPDLDLRLRTMAVRESHAQASTYRFTAATLASAITEGETADSMRAFLAGISLTGLPQPLDYLVGDVAARHGLVRVMEGDDGRARITGDEVFLTRIAVDQSLRHLGIIRADSRLIARANRETTCWALADAHYPAVAVDAEDRPVTVHRHDLAPVEPPATTDVYADLIARLRTADGGADAETAWRERELDAAVRAKATIAVTVRMPDGTERTLTLEAAGLGGGRLRGRDHAADVERTLPVSMIVRVDPVG